MMHFFNKHTTDSPGVETEPPTSGNTIICRLPLWLQLFLAFCSALFCVYFLFSLYATNSFYEFEKEKATEKRGKVIALLAATSIDALISEDIPLLESTVTQAIDLIPDIVDLSIENELNEQLLQLNRTEVATGNELSKHIHPVEFAGESFGRIIVLWDSQQVILVTLCLLVGLTLLLASQLVVRHIRCISVYLQFLSENRQQRARLRLPNGASKEILILAKSAEDLNLLIKQRDQREQELLKTRTQLQVAHDKVLSANHVKADFIAVMSHEIRTPMNAIQGVLGLLEDNGDSQQRRLIAAGRESSKLLLNLINDILDFSKMESGKLRLKAIHFNLHEVFRQSIELMLTEADRKGLLLNLILDTKVPIWAEGDPDRLRQILLNLINNAIKFTVQGSVNIRVFATLSNHRSFVLNCEVEDTGVGITKEYQATMFEEFSMADQSLSRRDEGTGLGLAICERLIKLMDGRINVSSKINRGTSISFSMPMQIADRPTIKEIEQKHHQPFSLDNHILLVENDPSNQLVSQKILEHAGLRVDVATNGQEALDAQRDLHYDLILMDISMPKVDGIEACRRIRLLPGVPGLVPIVALTAHAMPEDRERFLDVGMNDCLTKPINRAETLKCISRWIDNLTTSGTTEIPDQAPVEYKDEHVAEAVLAQLVQDTAPDILPELIDCYLEDARRLVTQIQDALVKADLERLEFDSHSLGSCALSHGNIRLGRLAREIKRHCAANESAQAIELATALPALAKKSFSLLAQRAEKGFDITTTGAKT